MTKFNLNNYVLVQITSYGWEELNKKYGKDYIENYIISSKEVIDGEDWYKMQLHQVITRFGTMIFAANPAPIEINILI